MNNNIKEELIELVRKYECLYNTKNKEYKNLSYKTLLWEKIGATLQIQGTKAKDAWRSLRDGYIRHKKTIRGQTGASRKYLNFTWSSQMSFLDGTLELRPTSTNITPPLPDSNPPQPPSLVPRGSSPEPRESSPVPRQPSPVIQAGPSWRYPEVDDSPSLLGTPDFPSLTQSQRPPTTSSQSLQSPASRTNKKKNDSRSGADNAERVLEYLKNKNKREWDDVDHLFMSYAKSFKTLSVRNKAKIKVELAKLFADAELDEFENSSTNEQHNQSSSLMYLSPAYSIISNESGEAILVTDEHVKQPIQPVLVSESTSHEPQPIQPVLVSESTSHEPTQEVFLAIDLTNYNSNETQN